MFRAWAHLSLGDFERAIEDASLSVRQPRAPFPAWATLACALGHAGRVEEGKAALAKALELEPRMLTMGLIDQIWPNLDSVFFVCFYDGLRAVAPGIPDPRTIDRARRPPREPSGDGRQ